MCKAVFKTLTGKEICSHKSGQIYVQKRLIFVRFFNPELLKLTARLNCNLNEFITHLAELDELVELLFINCITCSVFMSVWYGSKEG